MYQRTIKLSRKQLLSCVIIFTLIAIAVAGTPVWRSQRADLPRGIPSLRHVYPSDDGKAALLLQGQRVELDFGDMSQWTLTQDDEYGSDSSHLHQLNRTTYLANELGGNRLSLARKDCNSQNQSCVITIYFYVHPLNDYGLPVSLPNNLSGRNEITYPLGGICWASDLR